MNKPDITRLFKALSEPVRLRIVSLLTSGELCVCDLTEVLQLPQSTVSRHMSLLRLTGLVQDHRNGKWVHYRLAENTSPVLEKIAEIVSEVSTQDPYRRDRQRLEVYQNTKSCR